MTTPPSLEIEIYKYIDSLGLISSPAHTVSDKSLSELGIDSLGLMDLSFGIEKKFKKRVDFDTLESNSSINSLIAGLVDAD